MRHESGSGHVLPRCGLRETPRICGDLRWSRNGFWSFCENELEQAKKIADLRAGDNERRQQAQSKVVSAIDEQTLTQSFGDEWIAIDGEFDAEEQAFAADFADEIEFGGELGEAFAELGAAGADVGEQLFAFDDAEKFEGGGANQRAAGECRAVQAWRDARGYGFGGQDCTERQTRSERLGNEHDVGLGGEFLISEIAPGAAETALNFVGDKQSAVLRGEGASAIPEGFGNGVECRLALNRFGEYCANGVVEIGFEIRDVDETNKFNARHEGCEQPTVIFCRGYA